jgi:hypothetical protein
MEPNDKPVDLMRWLLEQQQTELAPMSDTLTLETLRLAIMHEGRPIVGLELDPAYAHIIRERLATEQESEA